jgi:hypothetical protein
VAGDPGKQTAGRRGRQREPHEAAELSGSGSVGPRQYAGSPSWR